MTLKEMQACAAETLSYFLEVMPDVPFGKDDIVIEFVGRKDMAERAKALSALYCPDKIINESQSEQLNNIIAANAIVGREKSVIIVRIDYRQTQQGWRRILFHEFMHIFCGKLEVDGEHFIDIYGCGHTPDMNPKNKAYDGAVNAGYVLWSEFIAQYFALIYAEDEDYWFSDIGEFIADILSGIGTDSDDNDKSAVGMVCAYILTCVDTEAVLDALSDGGLLYPDSDPGSERVRGALLNILLFLCERLQNEKPWKITEEMIADLGGIFIWFKTANALFLSGFEL